MEDQPELKVEFLGTVRSTNNVREELLKKACKWKGIDFETAEHE